MHGRYLLVLSHWYLGVWVCCVSVSASVLSLWDLPVHVCPFSHVWLACVYVCMSVCVLRLCVCLLQLCVPFLVFLLSPDLCVCVCVLVCQCVCPCVSGDFSVAYWVYHGDQLATSTLDLLIVEAPGVGCLPTRLMCECICMSVCMCVYSCVALPLPLSFCDQAHLVTKGGD